MSAQPPLGLTRECHQHVEVYEPVVCIVQVLVPPLRELEAYIFERLYRFLWTKALLESANREPASQANFSPHVLSPTHKASQHEDAISRWLDALQVGHPC